MKRVGLHREGALDYTNEKSGKSIKFCEEGYQKKKTQSREKFCLKMENRKIDTDRTPSLNDRPSNTCFDAYNVDSVTLLSFLRKR